MMNIVDLQKAIIDRMQFMIDHAVDAKGEERAFSPDEDAEFKALTAAATALKPIAEKQPNVNELLKSVFERK